jgi:hypothetical protein
MKRPLSDAGVLKELGKVGDRLAAAKVSRPQRLALLRKQAELGDRRDAAAKLARRITR